MIRNVLIIDGPAAGQVFDLRGFEYRHSVRRDQGFAFAEEIQPGIKIVEYTVTTRSSMLFACPIFAVFGRRYYGHSEPIQEKLPIAPVTIERIDAPKPSFLHDFDLWWEWTLIHLECRQDRSTRRWLDQIADVENIVKRALEG